MTITHIVLFKFRADVAKEIRDRFLSEIKTLKSLPCVKSQRLIVGGPSITEPAEKSKGFQYALVSYHEDRAALDAYQASSEHERVTAKYFIPYKEDLVRFDFEVDQADEPLLGFGGLFDLEHHVNDYEFGNEKNNPNSNKSEGEAIRKQMLSVTSPLPRI